MEKLQKGLRVVIDLQFFSDMTDKEKNSLFKQLTHCHSTNRRMEKACHLTITSTEGTNSIYPRISPSNIDNEIQCPELGNIPVAEAFPLMLPAVVAGVPDWRRRRRAGPAVA